jgi:hypothetical protein
MLALKVSGVNCTTGLGEAEAVEVVFSGAIVTVKAGEVVLA